MWAAALDAAGSSVELIRCDITPQANTHYLPIHASQRFTKITLIDISGDMELRQNAASSDYGRHTENAELLQVTFIGFVSHGPTRRP